MTAVGQTGGAPPVPTGAQVSVVGDQMVVNGLPASLREFQIKGTRDDVLNFYKSRLIRRADAPVLSSGGHDVLSGWLHGTYVTVVVGDAQKSGYVTARLLQTDVSKNSVRTPPQNMLPGSKVHTQVDSKDGGRVSSLLVFSNQQSIDANVDHIKATLKQSMGMKVTEEAVHKRDGEDGRVVYLSNSRGADAVLTVATQGSRRVMTLNTLSSELGALDSTPSQRTPSTKATLGAPR